MTPATTDLQTVTPSMVESAYEGTANKCACGCSGTFYGPEYERSNEKVAAILKRVQSRGRRADEGKVDPLWTHRYTDGSEMWAYQTKSQLIRVEISPTSVKGATR